MGMLEVLDDARAARAARVRVRRPAAGPNTLPARHRLPAACPAGIDTPASSPQPATAGIPTLLLHPCPGEAELKRICLVPLLPPFLLVVNRFFIPRHCDYAA